MVVAMLMLAMCMLWLTPVRARRVARIAHTHWSRSVQHAPTLQAVRVQPSRHLALIHAPHHRRLR